MKIKNIAVWTGVRHRRTHRVSILVSAVVLTIMAASFISAFYCSDDSRAVSVWDGQTYDTSWYVESQDEYEISTAAAFAGLQTLMNSTTITFTGKTINLTTDVDLGSTPFVTLGASSGFEGTFNGNGHYVSSTGLFTTGSFVNFGVCCTALFASNSGTIKDLVLKGTIAVNDITEATSNNVVAGIVGNNTGTISGCSCTMTSITAGNSSAVNTYTVGGIAGIDSGSVYNCTNNTPITVTTKGTVACVGGIIGEVNGSNITIGGCSNAGTVTATGANAVYVGGVAGQCRGATVNKAYNSAAISGTCNNTGTTDVNACVGGVFGYGDTVVCSALHNSGSVTVSGSSSTGGVNINAGGAIGYLNGAICQQSYNLGAIEASNGSVGKTALGGIAGYEGQSLFGADSASCLIVDSYNNGSVTSTGNSSLDIALGGLAGDYYGGTIANSYNTGDVTGPSTVTAEQACYLGGIAGNETAQITNTYNCGNISGPTDGGSVYIGGLIGYSNYAGNLAPYLQESYWFSTYNANATGHNDISYDGSCGSFMLSTDPVTIPSSLTTYTLYQILNKNYSQQYEVNTVYYSSTYMWTEGDDSTIGMGKQVVFNVYTVKLVTDGGTPVSLMPSVNVEDQVISIATDGTSSVNVPGLTKDGYTFVGWSSSVSAGLGTEAQYFAGGTSGYASWDGSAQFSEVEMGSGYTIFENLRSTAGTITLTAVWASLQFTVTYDVNGGSGTVTDPNSPYDGGATVTVIGTIPTRSGCVFMGWADSSTATVSQYEGGSTLSPSGDITLYAVWGAQITYDGTSAKGSYKMTSAAVVLNTDTAAATSPGWTKGDFSIIGWSTSSGALTVDYAFGAAVKVTGPMTLYAVWGVTLTYRGNNADLGAAAVKTVVAPVGSGIKVEGTDWVKTGCTFGGWTLSGTADKADYAVGSTIILTADTTLYALWQVTLTYDANGGAGESITVGPFLVGTRVDAQANAFTYESHVFKGWSRSAEPTSTDTLYQAGDKVKLDASATLYAIWQGAEVKVTTAIGQGGTLTYSPSTVRYGDAVTFNLKLELGYLVQSVTVNGEPLSAEAVAAFQQTGTYTLREVTADVTFAVTLAESPYVVVSWNPGGRVLNAAGEKAVSETVTAGSSRTYTFYAYDQYWIDSIAINGTKVAGDELSALIAAGSYTFSNIQGKCSLVIAFTTDITIPTYTITTSAQDNNGMFTPETQSVRQYYDATVQLKAATGYVITGITIDGAAWSGFVANSTAATITLEEVNADHVIAATFLPVSNVYFSPYYYEITMSPGESRDLGVVMWNMNQYDSVRVKMYDVSLVSAKNAEISYSILSDPTQWASPAYVSTLDNPSSDQYLVNVKVSQFSSGGTAYLVVMFVVCENPQAADLPVAERVIMQSCTIKITITAQSVNGEMHGQYLGFIPLDVSPETAAALTALTWLVILAVLGLLLIPTPHRRLAAMGLMMVPPDRGRPRHPVLGRLLRRTVWSAFAALAILAVADVFYVAGGSFRLLGTVEMVSRALWVLILCGLVYTYFDAGMGWAVDRRNNQYSSLPLLMMVGEVLIIVAAAGLALQALGTSLVYIVASLGILSTALGLGAKKTMSQFFSGLTVLARSEIKRGDIVTLNGGSDQLQVLGVGIMTSSFKNWSNSEVFTVPNSTLAEATIVNQTRHRQAYRFTVTVRGSYWNDYMHVRDELLVAIKDTPHLLKAGDYPVADIYCAEWDWNNLTYDIRVYTDSLLNTYEMAGVIREEVCTYFHEHGIKISFEYEEVHLKGPKAARSKLRRLIGRPDRRSDS